MNDVIQLDGELIDIQNDINDLLQQLQPNRQHIRATL